MKRSNQNQVSCVESRDILWWNQKWCHCAVRLDAHVCTLGEMEHEKLCKMCRTSFTSKNSFSLYILVIKSTLDLVYYNHTIFCQLWTWHGCIDINSESWVPLTTDYKSKEIKVAMENLIEGRENCFWLYPYQHAWSAPRNKHNVRRNKAEYRITFA